MAQISSSEDKEEEKKDAKEEPAEEEEKAPAPKTQKEKILDELTDFLGSRAKASAVVESVLDDLNETYDDGQILPVLMDQAKQLEVERAQGKRVDKVVRALTQTVGNDEKARAAIERVFDSLGDKYKADQLISALEKDVAKIAAVTKAKKEAERDVED